MKLNKIIFAIALFSLFSLNSCSDSEALEPVNQTRISAANAFETPERSQQQVLGMYAQVKSGNFMGGRYYVYQDIRGEEFNNERQNLVTNLSTWNFLLSSSTQEVQNLWTAGYLAINRCNIVIEGLETSPINTTLKNQYIAEAKFLRALSYFSLVTLYARPYWDNNGDNPGLPLRLKAITSSGENNLARSSVAQVYNQILSDLNDAEVGVPTTYGTAYDRTTRAHKNTVIALKTRVLLSKRDYTGVITEANKMVSATAPFIATSGVPNKLNTTVSAAFAMNATTDENILSFAFSSVDLPGTQNGIAFYWSTLNGNGAEYSLIPTGIISNTDWKTTDARRSFNAVVSGKTYLQTKWSGANATIDYMQVIRYAEVMLNLAEAIVRNTNTIDPRAVALLNSVRQRADSSTSFTVASFTSAPDLLDKIAIERRIEFLGEGFRSLDIMRLGQPFPAKGPVSSISASNDEYIWPIPQNELLYNKLCTPNPGY